MYYEESHFFTTAKEKLIKEEFDYSTVFNASPFNYSENPK